MTIPARLRRSAIERAGNRCEYCGLSQLGQEAVFHIDHVVPRNKGGRTILANLALACVSCSLRKGARLAALDPDTDLETPLFHPRKDLWNTHVRWRGNRIVGVTPTGRATIDALKMNRPIALAIREEEAIRKRHPSDQRT